MKPFVKWVGGKRSIIEELKPRVPVSYTSYHEPFVGGGALFFALGETKAYLSDINFYLIQAYRTVKNNVDSLISELRVHKQKHDEKYYREARLRISKETDAVKIASLFIYLNKTCYNGLYRANKSGLFNVPMGKYKDPAILDEENLLSCSKALKNTEIWQQSFRHSKPEKNAFYYLDPPYHDSFSGYDGSGFGDEAHKKLAEFCGSIDKSGGHFMLSNSDTPLVRELYQDYRIEVVSASRFVSCKGNDRKKQYELIIRNY